MEYSTENFPAPYLFTIHSDEDNGGCFTSHLPNPHTNLLNYEIGLIDITLIKNKNQITTMKISKTVLNLYHHQTHAQLLLEPHKLPLRLHLLSPLPSKIFSRQYQSTWKGLLIMYMTPAIPLLHFKAISTVPTC